MSTALSSGTLIDQRFVIEATAGSGGMGTVYRGRDNQRHETVAIKLLNANLRRGDETERFAREVQILSELCHPGIVSYVAHGVIGSGQPYLAMEWLQGEDLAQRLRRSPLSPQESLTLLRRLAEALDVAHQRNIVHRDLKPSNLFLRNGDIDQVTILDFGIARRSTQSAGMTRTGLVIGTPEYMSPEQARGVREIFASADIFSLGCVLYECLVGQPPFVSDVLAGVMAKILFEAAAPLRTHQPELPEILDTLLAHMLEKDPGLRLQNAGRLLEFLDTLELDPGKLPSVSRLNMVPRPRVAPPLEHQLVSVLLATVPSLIPAWDMDTTISAPADSEPARALQRDLAIYGAKVEILADGAIVAVLTQRSHLTATDQAAQAARCALALKVRFPEAISTLTTGRALLGGSLPLGEAFERSLGLRQVGRDQDHGSAAAAAENIFLDGVTAGLLNARFELRRLAAGVFALRGERLSADENRSLLGQPTMCVGRDRELSTLDLLFAEVRDDCLARVALIIAPPGMGKSRLRHEFLRRLRARHEPVQVLIGRGDPLTTGSPYALLAQAVRQLCGILDGEATEAQPAKLWQHVHRRLSDATARRVVEFIGDACGIYFADAESAQLQAARGDTRMMTEQVQRAFIDLLRAECDDTPLLLVLEDVHWSDASTVRLVDAVLRELGESRLMVLALARPEVETLFPRLWAERRCQGLRLEGLNRRAGEQLVRQVLGTANAAVVMRIVEQSAGNPLFLEELIRAVAEGKGDEMPETVLAMLQSRLLRLEPSARRLLRAASIFGQTFARGGLTLLLRAETGTVDVDRWLQRLSESEILEPQRESRFSSDPQYRFRHALLRDAAYSLLTPDSQRLGHRLAVRYLEQLDDSDPVVLAEHCERGNDLARASSLYLRAAELAHHRGDAETAVARAQRGLSCGPDEIARLGLLVVLCQVHLWRNQWAQAAEFADEVMRLSAPGSPSWAIAATAKLVDARYVHRHRFLSALDEVCKVEPEIDAVSMMAFALAIGIYILDSAGEFALAASCLQRLHDIVEPVAAYNPVARAWLNRAHAHREAWVNEDPWAGLRYSEQTRDCFQEANHNRGALDGQVFIGMNAWYLGDVDRAEKELRATLAIGDDLGLVSSLRTLTFIQVLCARGELEEAEREARALADTNQSPDLTRGSGLWALGEVLYHRGAYAEAEQQLGAALVSFVESPLATAAAQTTLAYIQLAVGRAAEALVSAQQAVQRFETLGSFGFYAARVHLVYAQALDAVGNRDEAIQIVNQALVRIARQADKIGDPAFRHRFLHGVTEHAKLAALATAWGMGTG